MEFGGKHRRKNCYGLDIGRVIAFSRCTVVESVISASIGLGETIATTWNGQRGWKTRKQVDNKGQRQRWPSYSLEEGKGEEEEEEKRKKKGGCKTFLRTLFCNRKKKNICVKIGRNLDRYRLSFAFLSIGETHARLIFTFLEL